MADIKIENDKTKEILTELEKAVKLALTDVGIEAVDNITSRGDFPADTGLLKNSITFAVSGESPLISSYRADKKRKGEGEIRTGSYQGTAPNDKTKAVYIGTNVEYAKYVEYGTSKMVARDFMNAPLKANFGHYKEIMEKHIKGL